MPRHHPAAAESYRTLRRRIGANLHAIRTARNLPLTKLARLSGLPAHIIDHWELGKNEIDLLALTRLALALNVTIDQFLKPEGS